ncbi:MAG: hypothetical protein C0483_04215 [Pirellula sp.]|nr:hypothetical protein [Pirellula sp.]
MAHLVRTAVLVGVIAATCASSVVALAAPPKPRPIARREAVAPQYEAEAEPTYYAAEPEFDPRSVDLAPRPPQLPTVPRAQLGEEILQDDLPPHESVVEEAPPIYADDPRAPGASTGDDYVDEPSSTWQGPPPGVQRRLQHHPLKTYLENRPRQMPLMADSWLNRPFGMSYFVGGMFLDDPIQNVVGGDVGLTYGGRLSWDLGPHWGIETRLAGADVGVRDLVTGTDLRHAKIFYWDVNWLWYWTGDTRWRPYALVGSGLNDINFYSTVQRYHNTLVTLPFGVGMKYRHSTRLALRFELLDNYTFSSGQVSDMHNITLTAGMEIRIGGGRSRSYWPWNPGRNWW